MVMPTERLFTAGILFLVLINEGWGKNHSGESGRDKVSLLYLHPGLPTLEDHSNSCLSYFIHYQLWLKPVLPQ